MDISEKGGGQSLASIYIAGGCSTWGRSPCCLHPGLDSGYCSGAGAILREHLSEKCPKSDLCRVNPFSLSGIVTVEKFRGNFRLELLTKPVETLA